MEIAALIRRLFLLTHCCVSIGKGCYTSFEKSGQGIRNEKTKQGTWKSDWCQCWAGKVLFGMLGISVASGKNKYIQIRNKNKKVQMLSSQQRFVPA